MVDIMDMSQASVYGDRIPLETRNKALSRCYLEMGIGLLITALTAWLTNEYGLYMRFIMSTGVFGSILLVVATLVLTVIISASSLTKMKSGTARLLFYFYAALMGFTLSTIFLVYNLGSITLAFVLTSMFFFALTVYGLTTKNDLSKYGPVFLIALIVLCIAELVIFIFVPNPMMIAIVTAVSILVFAGMTAYDTQAALKILTAVAPQGEEAIKKASINCALSLYLDFLNMFINILRIIGLSSDR